MCPAYGCGRTWTAGPDGFRRSRAYQFVGIDVPLRHSGFSRSVGSTDFAITLHCPRKLAAPPQLDRLRRCCRETVGILFAHNCPGNASCLVRQGHGDNQARTAATQGHQPRIGLACLRAQQHRMCAVDQQAPEIAVASFADPAEAGFAAGGVLSRYETEPGGKLSATVKLAGLYNSCRIPNASVWASG
jgi:hypothetical protein